MNKHHWLSRALCAAFIAGLLLPALAGGKQTPDIERINEHGRIDWTNGAMYATGLGAVSRTENNDAKAYLKARGFAKLDALRNLLMVVDHVRIDSHTVGVDFETQSDTIRAEVSGIVKGAQVISERNIKVGRDNMVEVTVLTHMYGDQGIARAFLPEVIERNRERAPEPPVETSRDPEPAPVDPAPITPPRYNVPEPETVPTSGPYSSVIIDARGYKLARCMSPKILRQDGSEVWGTVKVDPDYVLEHGIVIYAHNMEQAKQLDRCGRNPLVLRACGSARTAIPSDAVLSDSDAARLMACNGRDGFLNKFNVIFVVDPLR